MINEMLQSNKRNHAPKTRKPKKKRTVRSDKRVTNDSQVNKIYNDIRKLKNDVQITEIQRAKKNGGHLYNTKYDINPGKLRNPKNASADHAARVSGLKTVEYLYGALHPAIAVSEGLDVKYPSHLPIPSACIRVRTTISLTTGTNGNMFINYVPGGLITANASNGQQSLLTVNSTCNGAGTAGTNSFVAVPYIDVPQIFDRWRLTAAEMAVKYVGPVLSQAGTQHSCVHYEPVVAAAKGTSGTGTIASQSNGFLDRLSSNIGLIKSGLWNEEAVTTVDSSGRTHLFTPDASVYNWPYQLPTSASNYTLCGINSYFSEVGIASAAQTYNASSSTNARQYCWFFQNLPASTTCLQFETYEIYEFIPDIAAVSVVSASLNDSIIEYPKYLKDRHSVIKNKESSWKSVASKVLSTIGNVSAEFVIPMVEKYLSTL